MKTKYGNSFGTAKETISLSADTIWVQADKFLPKGLWVGVGSGATAVGAKIPAGTPVGYDAAGTKVVLNPNNATESSTGTPIGMTYEDAYMGVSGCSLTVVLAGIFNESLYEGTAITAAQKAALPCIHFVKE